MKKRIISLALAVTTFTGIFSGTAPKELLAKSKYEGVGRLRIYSTSDLHGQSTTFNYDTASLHKNGSLAQISTVIKNDKKTLKNGNTLLVDSGDTIFGIGAKSPMEKKLPIASSDQYMYKLMATMGYDALTLGNHDFDYGYDYEKKVLEDSGLADAMSTTLFLLDQEAGSALAEKLGAEVLWIPPEGDMILRWGMRSSLIASDTME